MMSLTVKEDRIILHCTFECRLLTKEARIFQKVDIIGATVEVFFHIHYCTGNSIHHIICVNDNLFVNFAKTVKTNVTPTCSS